MSDSLREQLLKAGLVSERQVRQATQVSRQQQHKRAKSAQPQSDMPARPDADAAARQARARKIAYDMELNRRQVDKAAAQARAAEARQLIERHRVPAIESGDDYFNFTVDGRIRRIAVTPDLRARLVAGALVIVGCHGHYALVTPDVAARIRERDPGCVVEPARATDQGASDDDFYKDFVVPDDLTW